MEPDESLLFSPENISQPTLQFTTPPSSSPENQVVIPRSPLQFTRQDEPDQCLLSSPENGVGIPQDERDGHPLSSPENQL
eukprot:Awhi_evm2s3769